MSLLQVGPISSGTVLIHQNPADCSVRGVYITLICLKDPHKKRGAVNLTSQVKMSKDKKQKTSQMVVFIQSHLCVDLAVIPFTTPEQNHVWRLHFSQV